jgi:hypothetical protein
MLKKNTGNKNSSCKGYQSIGSFCFDGKMEDENSKCLNSTNIKTNEKVNDVGSHEHIIWEEDYNNLMNAYSICSKKSKSRD